MRNLHRALSTLLLLGFALHGCGGDAPGGAVVASGLDAPDRMIELAPELVYEVGGFDAPSWAAFGEITATAFDARGHLYVLDSQVGTVTEVDTLGAFVRTIGRRGQGPGELSSTMALAVTDQGEVAIFDLGHQAWVVYDTTGQFLRNVAIDVTTVGFPTGSLTTHAEGWVVNGRSGRIQLSLGGDDGSAADPTRPVYIYSLMHSDSSRVLYNAWDLPPNEVTDPSRLEFAGGGSVRINMPAVRAFEPPLWAVPLPDGRVAVVDTVGYRIKLVDRDGTVSGSLERPVAPVQVTPSIQEAERERRAEQLAESGGGGMTIAIRSSGPVGGGGGASGGSAAPSSGGVIDQASIRQLMEGRLASMLFAEEIPVIESVSIDAFGRLWIQRSSGRPGEAGPTDLLTVDGRYLGTIPPDGVRMPEAFGPRGIMVREVTDELDVPTLIVERLPAEIGQDE